jgi:hypothetical protein
MDRQNNFNPPKETQMKRTIKSFLAAAGLAFVGLSSLLTATPAQAVDGTTEDSMSNGILCKRYKAEAYPQNYNYFYCADPSYLTTTGHDFYVSIKRYNPSTPGKNPFGNTMSANNLEIYVFERIESYQTYFGYSSLPAPLTATATSFADLNPTIKAPNTSGTGAGKYTGIRPRIVIFRSRWVNDMPAVIYSMTYNLDHELGHFMDWWTTPSIGGPRQAIKVNATKPPFVQLVEQDIAHLSAGAPYPWVVCNNIFISDGRVCTNGVSKYPGKSPWEILQILNPYYFNPQNIQPTTDRTEPWAELWAGEMSTIGAQPNNSSGFNSDINNWMKCSRLYASKRFISGTEPTPTEITGTVLKTMHCTVPVP